MSNERDNRNLFGGQILSMRIGSLETQLEASMLGIDNATRDTLASNIYIFG
jgi:hypothetical protein